MAGSTATPLTNSAVSASGEVDTLLIEKFNGMVHEQYLKGENLQAYFDMQEAVGTSTISNKYIGETSLQALVAGQEPEAGESEYDKNSLTIDTAVIARNIVATLHDVQNDINGQKSKLAANQVKQLKKLEDQMIIQQMIYGVISNTQAARTTPRVSGHGFSIKVVISDAQATDPNSLLASIEYALEQQVEQEVDINDVVVLAPWTVFNALSDAERLINKDYTTVSGVTMNGFTLKTHGTPIVPSNRFPKVVNTTTSRNVLSKASNQFRYDNTAEMLNCVAVLFAPDALLLGRSIALQGDIFWDQKTKCWFIDSWYSQGAIPDRWEAVSGIFKGGSENAAVKARAGRKATRTVTVTP